MIQLFSQEYQSVIFHRSNTIVADDGVYIGERYFPMDEVLGAQIFDVTAGNRLIERLPNKTLNNLGLYSGIVAVMATSLLNFFVPRSIDFTFPFLIPVSMVAAYFAQVKTPILWPLLRRHEYRLTLHTIDGSEEVIAAFDYPYLSGIADEINRRVTVMSLLQEAARPV